MARVKFGDVVKEVKINIDRNTDNHEYFIAGDHMDSENIHITRRGIFEGSDVGPAFIRLFKPGQILYGSRRTYLKKVAVADFEGITSNTTFVLESKDENVMLQGLLPFYMLTDSFTDYSIKKSKGSTNPYILFSDLAQYEFELPDIEKQRALLDLLTACDRAKEAYKDLIRKTDDLVKSQFIEMFGAELRHEKLGDCTVIEKGKTITREQVIEGDIPVVAAGIEPSCYHNQSNREAGVITVSASGANAGYVNYWNTPIFASDCNTVITKDESVLNNIFVYCRLKVAQQEIFQMQRGSGQPHVYAKDIAEIDVPIPPIEKQKEYAAFVEQSDKSKFELQQSIARMDSLIKSLIQQDNQ